MPSILVAVGRWRDPSGSECNELDSVSAAWSELLQRGRSNALALCPLPLVDEEDWVGCGSKGVTGLFDPSSALDSPPLQWKSKPLQPRWLPLSTAIATISSASSDVSAKTGSLLVAPIESAEDVHCIAGLVKEMPRVFVVVAWMVPGPLPQPSSASPFPQIHAREPIPPSQ